MSATVERFEALLSVRRYAEAEKCAAELIALYPDWGAAYTHLARAILEQKRFDEALQAAQEGVRKSPHDAWAHAIVSLIYERKHCYAEAIAAAHEALRLFPTYSFAFCLLSYSYDRLQKCNEALNATTTGLKHHPHDQELLRFHALNLYRVDRLDEAEQVARACLRLHPTSHASLDVLGLIHMLRAERASFRRLQLHRQAHDFFMQALRLQPTMEHIHLNARDNAVSCRRYLWMWFFWLPYLALLGSSTFLAIAWMSGRLNFADSDQAQACFGWGIIACILALVCGAKRSATYYLSLPLLERWGVPTLPGEEASGRTFWNDWRVMVGIPLGTAIVLAMILATIVK